MYQTKYHKPASIDDAVAALAVAEDGKVLGGGQTLLPTMKQHLASPTDLVDVGGISGMADISVSDGCLTIGAGARHADVAASSVVRDAIPALACLAGGIGDPAVRSMGTIGGSVANNDPAADYPAAVLGLGATVVTNTREIAADDFFEGMFTTALEEDEIITAIKFPIPSSAGYSKFPNPASRYAMVGVFVANGGSGARVAVTGAGQDGVFRADSMESALSSNFSAGSLDGTSLDADGMMADIHGTAEYRAHLVSVVAKRAVTSAV
ncbi:MAG: xanthine dehydrogenase family protein subunit M [Rhodobacteraceae bacterium]|nr:xanthine dehydrogenase family protein subunit M [Paracoccaceae bacterium]